MAIMLEMAYLLNRVYQTLFYAAAAGTLIGAAVAVTARSLFRAALGLALALFGVAALYLFMQAEFLAVSQLLIYVGAILTLLIFGVMLTSRIADPAIPAWNRQRRAASVLAGAFGVGLGWILCAVPWEGIVVSSRSGTGGSHSVPLAIVGRGLLSVYLLPFELLSVLLVGALVGAVFIAKQEDS